MSSERWYNVYAKRASLLYSNTTAVKLFTLPTGAIPLGVDCFTDTTSTSATLDVGVYGNTDSYVDGLDVSAAQNNIGTLLDRTQCTAPTDVYGLIAGASSGGPMMVTMRYIVARSRSVV